VRDFLDQPQVIQDFEDGNLRAGIVSFNDRARILRSLTDDPAQVRNAVGRLRPGGGTKIRVGLQFAQNALRQTTYGGADTDRVKMVIIISDGEFCIRDVGRSPFGRDQVRVVTIGLGQLYRSNPSLLRQMASEQAYALDQRDIQELYNLYTNVIPVARRVTMSTLTISDTLSANMALIAGSAHPVPSKIDGQNLQWTFDAPASPVTVTYGVEPLAPGVQPVSEAADARWIDSEDRPGSSPFPGVDIEVIEPTPTATPTATLTPTPTSTSTATPTSTKAVEPAYLPFLAQYWPQATPTPEKCVPDIQTVDVAIVIDTSTSMSEPTHTDGVAKLEAAIDAGLGLVDLLKFPATQDRDQAAVIGFNAESTVVTALTSDKAAIAAGLASLRDMQAQGTHIDTGIDAAFGELTSTAHRAGNHQAMIVVTDGFQSDGANDRVLRAADRAKAAGISVWTVGLGESVDHDLLRAAASSASQFRVAPNAAGLRLIYEEIARVIPCD
jgi:Mg-chelatase subunit ChlD